MSKFKVTNAWNVILLVSFVTVQIWIANHAQIILGHHTSTMITYAWSNAQMAIGAIH